MRCSVVVRGRGGVTDPVLRQRLARLHTTEEVLRLCERLNPQRIPGRLTLITRMGAQTVQEKLSPLLAAVKDAEHPVVWACDPMHGNTFSAAGGHKTRRLDDIMTEIAAQARSTSSLAVRQLLHSELTFVMHNHRDW